MVQMIELKMHYEPSNDSSAIIIINHPFASLLSLCLHVCFLR